MPPVLAHFLADWVLQSQWMATEKVKRSLAALVHVAVYGTVFAVFVTRSIPALAVIVGTHYLIDRYRLARHLNWAANFIAPTLVCLPGGRSKRYPAWKRRHPEGLPLGRNGQTRLRQNRAVVLTTNQPWRVCSTYGSPPGTPDHIGWAVMIVVDQCLHLSLNYAALRWLG